MNNNNNIEENNRLKGNTPFRTGNDYFENFNSKLQSRIEGFEEIKTIAPVLSNIPKYNPFEVPANYFDELPTIIQQRCIENKSSASIIEWLILLIKPRFVIPVLSMLFIAIATMHFMNKNATPTEKTTITEELTIEERLYNIDETTIIESLIATTATENKIVLTDDYSIESYLIDNNIDETNLYNDL